MKGIGAVVTTYKTVTLEDAKRGVNTYNHGTDGCVKNPDLDVRAHDMFKDGLGLTSEEILLQVEFIGKDYGGVAGHPTALTLAPAIAYDIFENRAEYWQAATRIPSCCQCQGYRETVAESHVRNLSPLEHPPPFHSQPSQRV
jgi:hypothetical protein